MDTEQRRRQRKDAEARAWSAAPRDYRSTIDGKRHVLVRSLDQGSHLVLLSSLTDDELWRMARRNTETAKES